MSGAAGERGGEAADEREPAADHDVQDAGVREGVRAEGGVEGSKREEYKRFCRESIERNHISYAHLKEFVGEGAGREAKVYSKKE